MKEQPGESLEQYIERLDKYFSSREAAMHRRAVEHREPYIRKTKTS